MSNTSTPVTQSRVNGTVTVKYRKKAAATPAAAVVEYRQILSNLAYSWTHVVTRQEKARWVALGKKMVDTTGKRKSAVLSGYAAYQSVNLNLHGMSGSSVTTPPDFAMPAPLPASSLELDAFRQGSASGAFGLILHSDPYAGSVQIHLASAKIGGSEIWTDSDFVVAGIFDGLNGGLAGTPLTGLFESLFPAPETGDALAVRMYPINDAGFRGPCLLQTATVVNKAAAQAQTGDDAPPAEPSLHVS